jgi:hypothetical protein
MFPPDRALAFSRPVAANKPVWLGRGNALDASERRDHAKSPNFCQILLVLSRSNCGKTAENEKVQA